MSRTSVTYWSVMIILLSVACEDQGDLPSFPERMVRVRDMGASPSLGDNAGTMMTMGGVEANQGG